MIKYERHNMCEHIHVNTSGDAASSSSSADSSTSVLLVLSISLADLIQAEGGEGGGEQTGGTEDQPPTEGGEGGSLREGGGERGHDINNTK